MSYLRHLPVNEMKIDQSFVREMTHDAGAASIVFLIAGLARSLGLSVVVEGVENQAIWEMLTVLHGGAAQGHLISRPMPVDEAMRWLIARSNAAA